MATDRLPTNYSFADLTLDVARRRVTRDGQPIELKALDFDLLRFLAESAPNVVSVDVLAENVWGRHFVSLRTRRNASCFCDRACPMTRPSRATLKRSATRAIG